VTEVQDQLGNTISLNSPARRIVSIVPSQTELLFHYGLNEEVVGITKFCIHPQEWFKSKTRVGGTKTLDIEAIQALSPDLVLANKEENSQEEIEFLQAQFPVYISDVFNFDDAFEMMNAVGVLTNKKPEAAHLTQELEENLKTMPKWSGSALYLMWNNPYMAAGNNTFIGHVLNSLGLVNCLVDKKSRYLEIGLSEIQEMNPNYMLLSSEPFPFVEKHAEILRSELNSTVILVDGEIFSWYGSRMLKMSAYFKELGLV